MTFEILFTDISQILSRKIIFIIFSPLLDFVTMTDKLRLCNRLHWTVKITQPFDMTRTFHYVPSREYRTALQWILDLLTSDGSHHDSFKCFILFKES